jgi:ribonucleotide reductase beta subunit family protein with ferritin-like domain
MNTYVTDTNERNKIFNCVENYPTIGRKINWVRKWLGEDNPFHSVDSATMNLLKSLKSFTVASAKYIFDIVGLNEVFDKYTDLFRKIEEKKPPLARQILINIIMEGLFFTGSFLGIFWINHILGGILPGLAKANELISRDEGLHTNFGIILYRIYIKHKLPQSEVHEIMREAVIIESEFIVAALPNNLIGVNSKLMIQYIEYIADRLLEELGYEKLYYVLMPSEFDFMKKQSISVRMTDFFIDPDVTEYGLSDAGSKNDDQELCVLSDDEASV